jgi:hypothetical protein
MDTIAIERAATAIPAKRRPKFGLKRLALTGLALAITLGGIAYGATGGPSAALSKVPTTPMPAATSPL